MNTFNRISASALLAAASLSCSPDTWALGLGDVTVESYLNQPLRARIDLVSQATDDLASVTAQLASASDYELIGASRDSVPVPVHFTIEDLDGDAYILATSRLPIGEPVVRLIVEVNWSSGRMLREYTLFLDPPTVRDTPPAPRVDARSAPAAAPSTPAAAAPSAAREASPTAAQTPRPAQRTVTAGEEYGPVQRGETLWGIASDWSRGTGMDINRVMIAIQRSNPSAFMNDNINLLKRGAILRMPAMEDVTSISPATAFSEVKTQTEEFTGQRAAQPVVSPATPLLAEESQAASVAQPEDVTDAGNPLEPAEEPAASTDAPADTAADAEPAAQLELVPPSADSELDSTYGFEESEESGEAGDSVEALREDLARTEEELVNQQQQNSYLEERIKELESQLASAEEGNVADADMANMENRLREERTVDQEERSRLAAGEAREPEKPWYSRFGLWLVGLLVVIAGLAGWLISRRGGGAEAAADAAARSESLREIQGEAEQVLRTLEDPEQAEEPGEEDASDEPSADDAEDGATDDEAAPNAPATKRSASGSEDAELLDEESSDPEIQLDLARAYISMGDKEAARVILEEVVANGTEEQQGEARKMLDVLES